MGQQNGRSHPEWELTSLAPAPQALSQARPSTWVPSESPDHPIRLEEKQRRDSMARLLGSVQVDDELEFHGLLDRQVGGLGAPEDFVNI
jgi:hypothetical protein